MKTQKQRPPLSSNQTRGSSESQLTVNHWNDLSASGIPYQDEPEPSPITDEDISIYGNVITNWTERVWTFESSLKFLFEYWSFTGNPRDQNEYLYPFGDEYDIENDRTISERILSQELASLEIFDSMNSIKAELAVLEPEDAERNSTKILELISENKIWILNTISDHSVNGMEILSSLLLVPNEIAAKKLTALELLFSQVYAHYASENFIASSRLGETELIEEIQLIMNSISGKVPLLNFWNLFPWPFLLTR